MTKIKGYFETAIDFGDRYFSFEADCVGSEVHFNFNGQYYIICLPNFDFKKPDGFGHPTPTFDNTRVKMDWLKSAQHKNTFGSEYHRDPKNELVLQFSSNHLVVRSRGAVSPELARKAKSDLLLWRDLFAKWSEVMRYEDLEHNDTQVQQIDSLRSYFVPSQKNKEARRIKNRKENHISIIANMTTGIEIKQLKTILKRASVGQYPPGYYMLLISALKHYNQKKYRQSILDSATAIEMTLTQLLDNKLVTITAQQRKLIFDKYRQISGLTSALKALGVTLPPDIGIKIGTPRNQAIHKGLEVTEAQAREALQVARAFIYRQLKL